MSLLLPPQDSPLRELFEVRHLAEICAPEVRMQLPTYRQAMTAARNAMHFDKGIRAIHSVCLKANGDLVLARFGCRGGVSTVWTFGRL